LVMACVISTGWVQSHRSCDCFDVNLADSRYGIQSLLGHIHFVQTDFPHGPSFQASTTAVNNVAGVESDDRGNPRFYPEKQAILQWRRDWAGFHSSDGLAPLGYPYGSGKISVRLRSVPYWFIVLPLTLLSAYLILVPSRKRPPTGGQPDA
jgi:hypothetical protein